jgi:thiol-disulfide isomerase/thioredoxin
MKKLALILSILFTTASICSKSQSALTSKKSISIAGIENQYIYYPDKSILMPDSINAVATYLNKQNIQIKVVPVVKVHHHYEFSLFIPDSTSTLILSITKPEPLSRFDNSVKPVSVIDNNNGFGFVIPIYNKKGKRYDFEKIDKATLLYHFAPSVLKLNPIPQNQVILWYKDTYRKFPNLKSASIFNYYYYLNALYSKYGNRVKAYLLEFARQITVTKKDEEDLVWAAKTYGLLGMQNEQQEIEDKILKTYPNGTKAKEMFWNTFYSTEHLTTSSISTTMNGYIGKFNDNSSASKDNFYCAIIALLVKNKEWDSLMKYELLVANKVNLSHLYNNLALRLLNEQQNDLHYNLSMAKILSQKTISYTTHRINNPVDDGDLKGYLLNSHDRFCDTYAQILFKLGQPDSAFYYQELIHKRSEYTDANSIERYCLYAEKAKGENYARQLIESQLLKGISTPVIIEQIKYIYERTGKKETDFTTLLEKSSVAVLNKNKAEIIHQFGTLKAKDFRLKNILGKTVSLSSLKGKVVVLDFWATWCVPCIATFPKLQEIVTKYNHDKKVTFLLIDIWENTTEKEMQEKARKLISTNNYTFNVLLDVKNQLSIDYKIESIPTHFIISKNGNMVYRGNSMSNITDLIEAAKKL